MSRFFALATFVIATASVTETVSAQPSGAPVGGVQVARVIATGGVAGRLTTPRCQGGATLEPAPGSYFTYALERAAAARDRPMVLDTGGLLSPHGVARFAAVNDPEALADLVDQLGYRALAFGNQELGAPRSSLEAVLRILAERGLPAIASNLQCDEDARSLCDVLVDADDPPSLHFVADEMMAVLAFLDPDALNRVSPELAHGVRLAPMGAAMAASVARARERAHLVVAVVDASVTEALEITGSLPERSLPDLVVLADTGDVLFARPPRVVPAIASPPAGDAVEVVVRTSALRDGYDMTALALGGRGVDVAPALGDFIDRVGRSYCAEWGRTLRGGSLTEPMDVDALADLAARVMETASDADVAILNRGALDQGWRSARPDALTASDVFIAFPYDEPLVVADVPSDWLVDVAQHADERGLALAGLAPDGNGARVLGRPMIARATYRVVTLRFLSSGGDRALPPLPPGTSWRPLRDATLRSVVIQALREESDRDPRQGLPTGVDPPEWIFRANLDGSFSGSSVSNPDTRYDVPLLNRADTLTLGVDVELHADATAPLWTWENAGILRYRSQWTESLVPGTAGAFAEAVDLVQLRSLGAWRGLRNGPGQWYLPDPFVEIFLESELTRPIPLPDVRTWHWMLFRPSAGARFPLADVLDLKLAVGLQAQLLEPGGEAQLGVGANLTLRPWDLLRVGERHATLQGSLDYFLVDPGDENLSQLRGSLDAAMDLVGPLALTLGVRIYAQQDGSSPVGLAIDATAGLRIGWLGRVIGR